MVIECRLVHTFELGLHTQFVGEIVDVKVEESALDGDGLPDARKIAPVVFAPEVRKYYGLGDLVGEAFSMGKSLG